MNPSNPGRRQPLPTILTVFRPIEEYLEESRPAGLPDAEASEALDPLDAFLVHRMLDLVPRHPVLIDAAIVRTGGTSSLLGLGHPRVRGVWAVTDPESLPSRGALQALRDHLGTRTSGLPPLKVVARSELAENLADQPGAVILADARSGDAASLADDVGRWLDERPDAAVLVLGLGRVGDCPAIAALLALCPPGSAKQFRLLREDSEVLIASRLGLACRRHDPGIAEAIERLRQSYTGNYAYLDLLRDVNDAALRDARIDADTLRGHWTFGPLSGEIEGLKRKVREADERASAAEQALREARSRPSSIAAIRRKLSPTPVGGAWRLARRVRRKLSPTPVGGAWRLARRGLGACLGRSG